MTRTRKNPARPERGDNPNSGEDVVQGGFNFGGFLGKLGGLVEHLTDLAETGQQLSRTGEIKGLDPQGKLRGVYGFSIRSGIGGQGEPEIKVEPFGNIRQRASGEAVFDEVREPLVDVHEEEDHVLVLAEIPGVSKKDVQLELDKDQLTIQAKRGEKHYRKEVELPRHFTSDQMHWECINGILRIRFDR